MNLQQLLKLKLLNNTEKVHFEIQKGKMCKLVKNSKKNPFKRRVDQTSFCTYNISKTKITSLFYLASSDKDSRII